jgi:hypothetical protein
VLPSSGVVRLLEAFVSASCHLLCLMLFTLKFSLFNCSLCHALIRKFENFFPLYPVNETYVAQPQSR